MLHEYMHVVLLLGGQVHACGTNSFALYAAVPAEEYDTSYPGVQQLRYSVYS